VLGTVPAFQDVQIGNGTITFQVRAVPGSINELTGLATDVPGAALRSDARTDHP